MLKAIWVSLLIVGGLIAWGPAGASAVDPRYTHPVKAVGGTLLPVAYQGGTAVLPVFVSADWSKPQPDITRAVLILHGMLRNADDYFAAGMKARDAAGEAGHGALVVAPQFLANFDIAPNKLPTTTLGWEWEHWAGGEPALTPAPLSGFDALDAVLAKLADRSIFPNLSKVVIAGFSAGGQIAQRYAVVGNGETALTIAGIAVTHVVSDPSSYLYFTPERPVAMSNCPDVNAWRYGFDSGVPPYVRGTSKELEHRYIARDVTYLMGMADIDPNHPVLDKSCAGEAQGPQRVARGHAYFAMLESRHGGNLRQRLIDVPGVAHDGAKMFNSACGLAVLFGKPGCPELDLVGPVSTALVNTND